MIYDDTPPPKKNKKWRPLKSIYLLMLWCCYISNQSIDSRKGRKERKQGKKSGPAKAAPACGIDGGLPDMGALCI